MTRRMTSLQDRVLARLANKRAFLSPVDMANDLDVPRGSIYGVLQELVKKGFVCAHPHVRGQWGITIEGYAHAKEIR